MAELFTKLNTWGKDRKFVVSRILKPEKDRAQLSLFDGDEVEYFFFVTNTELHSEKIVISYKKRGNAENYIWKFPQNSSPVEKNVDNFMLTWNSGYNKISC